MDVMQGDEAAGGFEAGFRQTELVGGDRWILAEGGRILVNATTGVAIEAVRDQQRVWVIRFHAASLNVDLARTDGDRAEIEIDEAFGRVVRFLLGPDDSAALVLEDVLAEIREDEEPASEPES